MESNRFDTLTCALAQGLGRRGLLRGLVGILGLAGGLAEPARAKKKRKKPKFNSFGCVDVGGKCGGKSANCCSGICEGKKPKKGTKDKSTCVDHNVRGCTLARSVCVTDDAPLSSCDPENSQALCLATTGKAGFCADSEDVSQAANCQVCARDTDCEALGFPPDSACVIVTGAPGCDGNNDCAGINGSNGTACFPAAV